MAYLVEFKNNATNETKMVKLTKTGEQYVNGLTALTDMERLAVIKEIQNNYLEQAVDLNAFTFHMVSDEDMSQVV